MENREETVRNFGRVLLLEGEISCLEQTKEASRRQALALERELGPKRWEWERMKEPGFFRRLLGNPEEKKERAYRVYKEAEYALEQAKRKAEADAAAFERVKEELSALSGVREEFLALKDREEMPELGEKIRIYLTPAVLASLERCLAALEEACQISRELVNMSTNDTEGQKLACFAKARAEAERLLWMLEQYPEPERWICDYLRNPDGFLLAAATQYSRRDRLNSAIGQLYRLRDRLKNRS